MNFQDDYLNYHRLGATISNSKNKTVTFFGSARNVLQKSVYEDCKRLSNYLAVKGVNVLTGGGPGIMEAANKGAYIENKNLSYAANIVLPHEQEPNAYQGLSTVFTNFALRNRALFDFSDAFIVYPGGFGTMYEVFAILTEMQCDMIKKSPIILVDKDMSKPSTAFAVNQAVNELVDLGTISDGDDEVLNYVKNYEEAIAMLLKLGLFRLI